MIRFPFDIMLTACLICITAICIGVSHFDNWVFVKLNVINTLLDLWSCVKLCQPENLNNYDNTARHFML